MYYRHDIYCCHKLQINIKKQKHLRNVHIGNHQLSQSSYLLSKLEGSSLFNYVYTIKIKLMSSRITSFIEISQAASA